MSIAFPDDFRYGSRPPPEPLKLTRAMARTLRVALLLGAVQAVQAAVAEMLVARVTNVLHETSPSVLLQKFIKADPKMDKSKSLELRRHEKTSCKGRQGKESSCEEEGNCCANFVAKARAKRESEGYRNNEKKRLSKLCFLRFGQYKRNENDAGISGIHHRGDIGESCCASGADDYVTLDADLDFGTFQVPKVTKGGNRTTRKKIVEGSRRQGNAFFDFRDGNPGKEIHQQSASVKEMSVDMALKRLTQFMAVTPETLDQRCRYPESNDLGEVLYGVDDVCSEYSDKAADIEDELLDYFASKNKHDRNCKRLYRAIVHETWCMGSSCRVRIPTPQTLGRYAAAPSHHGPRGDGGSDFQSWNLDEFRISVRPRRHVLEENPKAAMDKLKKERNAAKNIEGRINRLKKDWEKDLEDEEEDVTFNRRQKEPRNDSRIKKCHVLVIYFLKDGPKACARDLPVVHVGPTSDEEIDTLVKQERAAAWKAVGMMATVFAVYVALVALLGWCYSKLWSTPVMSESKPDVEVEDFRHGVFSCFEDMHICALSFCCMPYRWADTMKAAGVMSFWTGVLIFFVVSNLRMWAQDYGPILGLSAWLCSTLIFTYYRQQLRQIFSIKNDTMDKLKDFSLWCCCCCCAAAQEARQVQMKKLDV
eukprot:s61_g30.t1